MAEELMRISPALLDFRRDANYCRFRTITLRRLLTHRIQPHSNLEVGDRVRITTGPMTHLEAALERHRNEIPVVLKLEMTGRTVSVEVGAEEVEMVGPTLERTRPMVLNSFPRPRAGIAAS